MYVQDKAQYILYITGLQIYLEVTLKITNVFIIFPFVILLKHSSPFLNDLTNKYKKSYDNPKYN